MGNDGFPLALGLILAAAVLGALLVAGLVVGMFVSAAVEKPSVPLMANFIMGTVGEDIYFSADETTGGSLPYASYEWDFDNDGTIDMDGDGAEARDVMYTYEAPGTYVVKLTVTDAEDNSDIAYWPITVA